MRSGFLIIDKAPGIRSTQCVSRVKRILGGRVRVGHGGTLDQSASGVLVLLVGRATRASRFVMMLPKIYLAVARLGVRTDTDDFSGEVLSEQEPGHVDEESIDRALLSLCGHRDQTPPAFSAVKVKGRRAYAMAREGLDVSLTPRPVLVTFLGRTGPLRDGRDVTLRTVCRQGTYVRSIVRDLGETLGCGAAVLSLRRESLGPFTASDALPSGYLATAEASALEERILPVTKLSGSFVTYQASPAEQEMIASGSPLPLEKLNRKDWGEYEGGGYVLIYGKEIVSFARVMEEEGACLARPVANIMLEGS